MEALSFSQPPARVASAGAPNSSAKPTDAFFRDASICPDGSCVLAAAEDRSLSLFPLPSDLSPTSPSEPPSLEPHWTHTPPDSLLSTAWYPGASIADPSMFAFAVGVKDHPVHLLDGYSKRVRASYPIVDHVERFVAPHSMEFSADGTSLYCGFENAIEIFDVSVPGAAGFRLPTIATRSSRSGQKGIISCLAISPPSSSAGSFLAAGSYGSGGAVGLYDPSAPAKAALFSLLQPSQKGGVTQVAFNPEAPHLLFGASRQSSAIDVWDLRNTHETVSGGRMKRQGRTNQRLGFSIDPTGAWLAAGDQTGDLSVFNAQPLAEQLEPVATFSLSSEPLAAALFHPSLPLLLTCRGTRRFRQCSRRSRRRKNSDMGSIVAEDSDSESSGTELEEDEEQVMRERPSLEVWQLS